MDWNHAPVNDRVRYLGLDGEEEGGSVLPCALNTELFKESGCNYILTTNKGVRI